MRPLYGNLEVYFESNLSEVYKNNCYHVTGQAKVGKTIIIKEPEWEDKTFVYFFVLTTKCNYTRR